MMDEKLRERARQLLRTEPRISHLTVEDVCAILEGHKEFMREKDRRMMEARFSEITKENFARILIEERGRAGAGTSEDVVMKAVTERLWNEYRHLWG